MPQVAAWDEGCVWCGAAWQGDRAVMVWGLECCSGMGGMLALQSKALGDVASCAALCGSNGWAT